MMIMAEVQNEARPAVLGLWCCKFGDFLSFPRFTSNGQHFPGNAQGGAARFQLLNNYFKVH